MKFRKWRRVLTTRTRRKAGTPRTSRKEFLLQITAIAAGAPLLAENRNARGPKVLLVVAHPDDEYAFAVAVYRIARELGGTVDQIVITNGEAGYRYSRLAETYYGLPLTQEDVGRSRLPSIRKEETLRAGRILGIRNHWFLEQKDARFTLDGIEAFTGIWNVEAIRDKILSIAGAERYDFIFVLLPTEQTHGHHQAAALLTLQAVEKLTPERRPIVLGSEPSAGPSHVSFNGRDDFPLLRAAPNTEPFSVDRNKSFGPRGSMNYNIVVNWVIAEHKSQGLFQTEGGKHSQENFWLLDSGTPNAIGKTNALFDQLHNNP